jgi:hypothetical protein
LFSNDILIEVNDTYAKQTYRNRCNIYSANGTLPLTVPVVKNLHTPVKDILIDYSENWQKNHFRSILSAYKNSAFYEFYFPEFEVFFTKKEKYLIDLNVKILDKLLESYGIVKKYDLTDSFIKEPNCIDHRDKIHPKASKHILDADFVPIEYYQVFSDKFGFIPNLSSIDLLFNEGPMALQKIV